MFLNNSKFGLRTVDRKRTVSCLFWRWRLLDVDFWFRLRRSSYTGPRLIDTCDTHGATGALVDFDQRSTQAHFAAGDRKRRRQIRDESIHDWINGAPQNGVYRAAHARVAEESRTTRKNLLVGGLNVRMSSNDRRNFSIEESAQRDFFTRSLSMYVHDDVRSLVAHLRHRCIDRAKRVFQNRLHKCARLDVDVLKQFKVRTANS